VRRLVRLATWCSNNDIGFAGALAVVAEAINPTLAHYFLFYDEVRRQSGDSQREREQSRAEQSKEKEGGSSDETSLGGSDNKMKERIVDRFLERGDSLVHLIASESHRADLLR
jgi:hypothetical protein